MATNQKRIEQSCKHEWVRMGNMRVSELAQRELRPARVDKLLSTFDLDEIGVPVVSERGGHFFIIDGNHRFNALKQWLGDGWEDQRIYCQVYSGLTEAEEAEKFLQRNDTLAVNTFDKFRIAWRAGREVECDIYQIVQKEGLVITRKSSGMKGAVSAVGTLRKVYVRAGGDTLARTLRLIRDAYGDSGFEAQVIDGIGQLCGRYNGELKDDVAIDRLGNAHGGVKGLLNRAEVIHEQTGLRKGECVAAAAVAIINARRGGKKLQPWFGRSGEE